LAEALATIAELRARLGQNSRNSNKPPSSDRPGVKRERKEPTGRKPGGQPGHKGHRREVLPPQKVDEVVAVQPKGCSRCGGELEHRGEGPAAWRHQVVELPEVKPRVTEYQLRYGTGIARGVRCGRRSNCHRECRAEPLAPGSPRWWR